MNPGDTQPEHHSLVPGDDLYLTLLVVPYSLDRNNYPDLLVQLLARLSPIDGEPYTRLRQRLTANQEAKRHFVEFIAEAGGTLNPR